MRRPEAVVFDLDGTLFESESVLLPAYRRTFDRLREEGRFKGPTPPEERIISALGLLLDEIWKRVLPDADLSVRRRADELLIEYQLEELRRGNGRLYPGVRETVAALAESGVRLFIASNGRREYVEGVAVCTGIAAWFEAFYTAGEYGTASKAELVGRLLAERRIGSAWMVGDRASDVEAARKNGMFAVGCRYAGFGGEEELAGADVVVSDIAELLRLYRECCG